MKEELLQMLKDEITRKEKLIICREKSLAESKNPQATFYWEDELDRLKEYVKFLNHIKNHVFKGREIKDNKMRRALSEIIQKELFKKKKLLEHCWKNSIEKVENEIKNLELLSGKVY